MCGGTLVSYKHNKINVNTKRRIPTYRLKVVVPEVVSQTEIEFVYKKLNIFRTTSASSGVQK
jgi:hypothetical protein